DRAQRRSTANVAGCGFAAGSASCCHPIWPPAVQWAATTAVAEQDAGESRFEVAGPGFAARQVREGPLLLGAAGSSPTWRTQAWRRSRRASTRWLRARPAKLCILL